MLNIKLLNSLLAELFRVTENLVAQASAEQPPHSVGFIEPGYIDDIVEHIIDKVMRSHPVASIRLLAIHEWDNARRDLNSRSIAQALEIAEPESNFEEVLTRVANDEEALVQYLRPLARLGVEKALFSEIANSIYDESPFEDPFKPEPAALRYWSLPALFPALQAEAQHNIRSTNVIEATQVPLRGFALPSGARFVKVWAATVSSENPNPSSERCTTATLFVELLGGNCQELKACVKVRPYFARRVDSIKGSQYTALVWEFSLPPGFDTTFEVPTSVLSGLLYLQNPETTFDDFLNEDITLIVMSESSCAVEKFKMMEIAAPLNVRALLASKKI